MLSAANVSFAVKGKELLQHSSLQFDESLFHVIMGANGAGKSTLLKLLAGELKPSTGTIRLGGKDLNEISTNLLAKKRAVLSQHYNITFPIAVKDMVLMGRYPYFQTLPSSNDLSICKEAMTVMDVLELRERDFNTLSGGEAQKVQMSRVLAQIWTANEEDKKLLFLDEPVSHLDVKYQHQLLKAAKKLCRQNTTVIAILHDINLALSYADRILFMKQGKVMHDLTNLNGFSSHILKEVFDVDSTILYPQHHSPVVVF